MRNVFPKDTAEELYRIEQGKLLYVNKERTQDLINQQRINLADVDYLDQNCEYIILKRFTNSEVAADLVADRFYRGKSWGGDWRVVVTTAFCEMRW